MAIYKSELTLDEFVQEFKDYDRDYYSPAGYRALYDMFEEYSEELNEPFILDVIGIVCEFTEYDSFEEFQKDYPIQSFEELIDKTTVLQLDNGGLIIANF